MHSTRLLARQQRQDGAVMHGADEVLFDEGVNLVERLVQWERCGSSFFIRGHRMHDEGKRENLSIEKRRNFKPFIFSKIQTITHYYYNTMFSQFKIVILFRVKE